MKASLIADDGESQLWVMEIPLFSKLIAADVDLYRNFYQYIATLLAKRLKNITNVVRYRKRKRRKTDTLGRSTKRKESVSEPPPTPTAMSTVTPEDLAFRKRFDIVDPTEVIIKEKPCIHKHSAGSIYLSKNSVCFYAKVFGLKRKVNSINYLFLRYQ
jgi:hypothetical protein